MNSFFQDDEKWLFMIPILSVLGLIAVFTILWKLSNSIYKATTPFVESDEMFRVDQVFILHLIGLYLAVSALLSLSRGGISLFYIYNTNEYVTHTHSEAYGQTLLHLIASCSKLIIGITLIIKPLGWSKLLYKLRTFGLSNK